MFESRRFGASPLVVLQHGNVVTRENMSTRLATFRADLNGLEGMVREPRPLRQRAPAPALCRSSELRPHSARAVQAAAEFAGLRKMFALDQVGGVASLSLPCR